MILRAAEIIFQQASWELHIFAMFFQTMDIPEIAYDLLLQETYPSWLYPVKMGATTIWERWDGQKTDSTFQDAGMNSFNHYAYGAIGDWMYRVSAGIETKGAGLQTYSYSAASIKKTDLFKSII